MKRRATEQPRAMGTYEYYRPCAPFLSPIGVLNDDDFDLSPEEEQIVRQTAKQWKVSGSQTTPIPTLCRSIHNRIEGTTGFAGYQELPVEIQAEILKKNAPPEAYREDLIEEYAPYRRVSTHVRNLVDEHMTPVITNRPLRPRMSTLQKIILPYLKFPDQGWSDDRYLEFDGLPGPEAQRLMDEGYVVRHEHYGDSPDMESLVELANRSAPNYPGLLSGTVRIVTDLMEDPENFGRVVFDSITMHLEQEDEDELREDWEVDEDEGRYFADDHDCWVRSDGMRWCRLEWNG